MVMRYELTGLLTLSFHLLSFSFLCVELVAERDEDAGEEEAVKNMELGEGSED